MPAISAGSSLPSTSRSNRCSASSLGRSSPASRRGSGLGTGRSAGSGGRGSGKVGRSALEHDGFLKQKSPPVAGGQSNDRNLASRSVAPSRRMGRANATKGGRRWLRRWRSGCVIKCLGRRGFCVQRQPAIDGWRTRQWHWPPPGPSGCSSMVEQKPSKLTTRVRFPSPAPNPDHAGGMVGDLERPSEARATASDGSSARAPARQRPAALTP